MTYKFVCQGEGGIPQETNHKMSIPSYICIVLHNFPKYLNNLGMLNHRKYREDNLKGLIGPQLQQIAGLSCLSHW